MDKPNLLCGSLDWETSELRQQAQLSQLGQEHQVSTNRDDKVSAAHTQLLTWGMYMTDQNCPLRKPFRAGGTRCSSASHT